MRYFIDPINGNDKNSGICEALPLKSHEMIKALPGDEILF